MPFEFEIDVAQIVVYMKQGIDIAANPPLGTAINLVIGVFIALTIVSIVYDLAAGTNKGESA